MEMFGCEGAINGRRSGADLSCTNFFFQPVELDFELTDLPVQFLDEVLVLFASSALVPAKIVVSPVSACCFQIPACVGWMPYLEQMAAMVSVSWMSSRATLALKAGGW